MRRLVLLILAWWLGLAGDARADGLGPLAPEIKAAAVLVGAGATTLGDDLPLAFEVPLVLRAQIGVGRQRLHLWTRSDGARVFVGAAYEDRSTGSDVMVVFGLPVGGYF